MNEIRNTAIAIHFLIFLVLAVFRCSERLEMEYNINDETTIFPSKSENGIEARITLCEKLNKSTGNPLNAKTIFHMKNNSKVYAVIEVVNSEFHTDKNLMFHIDWLDSTGNSFFKKRIELIPQDSTNKIISLINISPDKREAGTYSLRVYFFRELIAEKKFKLVDEVADSTAIIRRMMLDTIEASIFLGNVISKKTGEITDAKTVFTIKNKSKLYAIVKLDNLYMLKKQRRVFYLVWIGPDDNSFFKKRIELLPNDSPTTLSSSITLSPQKRKPGTYNLRVYLYEKLIGEKKFRLKKKTDL